MQLYYADNAMIVPKSLDYYYYYYYYYYYRLALCLLWRSCACHFKTAAGGIHTTTVAWEALRFKAPPSFRGSPRRENDKTGDWCDLATEVGAVACCSTLALAPVHGASLRVLPARFVGKPFPELGTAR